MTTPREKYERRRETLSLYEEDGRIDSDTAEAIRELCDAYDDSNVMVSTPDGESTREVNTIMSWLYRLMAFGKHRNLTTASLGELREDVQAMHDGDHPEVKDGGLQKGTLRSYQSALRRFYRYHDFGVEPDDIPLFDQEDSPVDPEDMLTKAEIQEIREAADNPRDRMIFELLLYTGQRREALRTLRLKDVFAQDGEYRLNPNVDGLKGADERNGRRPLLGAKAAVQDWLDYHPDTSDPEHYLITARPGYSAVDPSDPVSGETIRRVMEDLKKETSIDKPMHPHAIRHNFVTIAKRDYDLPDDTVKYLIGHAADSSVMETTYSHLSGEDHIARAEEAWGIREEDDDSPLTPEVCPTCSEPLGPNAKACPRCGDTFTPDAVNARQTVDEAIHEGALQADSDEEREAVEKVKEYIENNPELVEEHPELVAEMLGDE